MSLNENWELKIRNKVSKALAKFPEKDKTRLVEAIGQLPLNPHAGDIEKIKGEEYTWRRRIGVYRMFYELIPRDRVIYIERRTSKTY